MASGDSEQVFMYEELIILPIQTPEDTAGIAFDIGSSLIKVAYTVGCTMEGKMKLRLLTAPCGRLEEVLKFVKTTVLPEVEGSKHQFFEACGLGFIINRPKILAALGKRFDETTEHACVSKAFHFGMSHMKKDDFVQGITQLHLHKEKVFKLGDDKPSVVPVGPGGQATKSHWVFKAEPEEGGSPTVIRRSGSGDLLNPVSAGVPCGGGHWIHGQEDDFDPTSLKDDFPCLICNMGSQFIYTVVDEEGIGKVVYRSEKGGLYFYGLGKLVTKAKDFEDLMRMVHEGETSHLSRCLNELPEECHKHFDLQSVDQIEAMMDLAVQTDPFSKVISEGIDKINPEDFAKTLHSAICIETIGITNLLARLFKVNAVYYTGNFVRNNDFFASFLHMTPVLDKVKWGTPPEDNNSLQYPMTVKSSFVSHGGYLGVIGASLLGMERINKGW